jgi:hypothetical protein
MLRLGGIIVWVGLRGRRELRVMVVCARDDVLWPYLGGCRRGGRGESYPR